MVRCGRARPAGRASRRVPVRPATDRPRRPHRARSRARPPTSAHRGPHVHEAGRGRSERPRPDRDRGQRQRQAWRPRPRAGRRRRPGPGRGPVGGVGHHCAADDGACAAAARRTSRPAASPMPQSAAIGGRESSQVVRVDGVRGREEAPGEEQPGRPQDGGAPAAGRCGARRRRTTRMPTRATAAGSSIQSPSRPKMPLRKRPGPCGRATVAPGAIGCRQRPGPAPGCTRVGRACRP